MPWLFKLINVLSFTGSVYVNHKNPFVETDDEELAKELGHVPYFKLIEEPKEGDEGSKPSDNEEPPSTENDGGEQGKGELPDPTENNEEEGEFTASGLRALKKPGQEDLIVELGGDPKTVTNEEERITYIQQLSKEQDGDK